MASTRHDYPLQYPNNPSSSSSPMTVSDILEFGFFAPVTDRASSSRLGSSSNSFQNEAGFLNESCESSCCSEVEFGFLRPDFRQNNNNNDSSLAGTVEFYERHVFLCYKNPSVWPPRIEASEFDRLPRFLSAAVLARKPHMKKKTRLTICEGHDGTETSNGDVLIFPDMIRYRRLTHFDVDNFVEEVLVNDGEWLPGTPEKLNCSYVFVCCHGSRDRRCGVCGPSLVSRFKEEIEVQGLRGKVSVSPCSDIGGHKYAGNVIIYGSSINGDVSGHWYGYVTPDDVPLLLEQHIRKGDIVDWLWRGQMGLTEDEQKIKSQELSLQQQLNVRESMERKINETSSTANGSTIEVNGCCQQNANTSCCQNPLPERSNLPASEKAEKVAPEKNIGRKLQSQINIGNSSSIRKVSTLWSWLENWEHEDTYAALAVVCAAVSVAIAYRCYKQLG